MWPRACKKRVAGILTKMLGEAACGRVHIKNGTRASHPVWDFKNLKGERGRVTGAAAIQAQRYMQEFFR